MTRRHSVLLVCDASRKMGSGHVMRMITLGVALAREGLKPTLFSREITPALIHVAADQSIPVLRRLSKQQDPDLADEINEKHALAVVFDGYQFNNAVPDDRMLSSTIVAMLDDNGENSNRPCHLMINQNLHAAPRDYLHNDSVVRLLLGPKYALIRDGLLTKEIPNYLERGGVLVSLGGTDLLGLQPVIVRHLRESGLAVRETGGLINPAAQSPNEMKSLMTAARVGVISLGTTTWETFYLGLPIVGLVVADNQLRISQSLQESRLSSNFDVRENLDLHTIESEVRFLHESGTVWNSRSERMRILVDGSGARRVAAHLVQLINDSFG